MPTKPTLVVSHERLRHAEGYFKASLNVGGFVVFVLLMRQDEEVVLQNPADVLLYVQVLPLALLPNPSVFSGKLADRSESCSHFVLFVCFFFFLSSPPSSLFGL